MLKSKPLEPNETVRDAQIRVDTSCHNSKRKCNNTTFHPLSKIAIGEADASSARDQVEQSCHRDKQIDENKLEGDIGRQQLLGRESSLGLEDFISNRLLEYGIVHLEQDEVIGKRHLHYPPSDPFPISSMISTSASSTKSSSNCEVETTSTNACGSSSIKDLQLVVEEIHRWLFVEGGYFENVEALMTNYCMLLRTKYSIPIDRLYYGGVGLHPRLTAYLWKWEYNEKFTFREMPEHIFKNRNDLFSPDEPFCLLEQGRAKFVRIKNSSSKIPPDVSKWFVPQQYTDYYALPDIHRNQSKGGIAWATKNPNDGFHPHHIEIFQKTFKALTTVMRLHTNDLVLNTLTARYEQEIQERTKELKIVNDRLEAQQRQQLQHFACMSHEFRTPLSAIMGLSSLLLLENEEAKEEGKEEENYNINNHDDNPQHQQHTALPQHVIDSIRMIHTSADLLRAVVNDVLDYSSMQNDEGSSNNGNTKGGGGGVFQVDLKPNVDLHHLLEDVVATMANSAKAKERSITLTMSDLSSNSIGNSSTAVPKHVSTDPRRLHQILFNLLGNACKFSKVGGKVELNVWVKDQQQAEMFDHQHERQGRRHKPQQQQQARRRKARETGYDPYSAGISPGETASASSITSTDGSRDNILVMAVKDYGKGIDKKDFETIFEPFNRASKETQTIYGGTGLGLAIASKLVKGLGGTIAVNSIVNEYTEFMIELPLLNDQNDNNGDAKDIRNNVLDTDVEAHCEHLVAIPRSIVATKSDCEERTGASFSGESKHSSVITTTIPLVQQQEGNRKTSLKRSHSSSSSLSASTSTSGSVSTVHSPVSIPSFASLSFKDIKALIVDDNRINQKVLQRMLLKTGITKQNIDIVDNGLKAVEIYSSHEAQQQQDYYDIIFMDIQMPVMDGLTATQQIKQKAMERMSRKTALMQCENNGSSNAEEGHNVDEGSVYSNGEGTSRKTTKIVFCTAHAVENYRAEAREAGGDGFISKPYRLNEIRQSVMDNCCCCPDKKWMEEP